MELVGQHHLPQPVQLGLRDRRLPAGMRHGREEFDIVQQEFAPAVVPLVVRLGGVGAAVQLEIQLAHPGASGPGCRSPAR